MDNLLYLKIHLYMIWPQDYLCTLYKKQRANYKIEKQRRRLGQELLIRRNSNNFAYSHTNLKRTLISSSRQIFLSKHKQFLYSAGRQVP